MIRINVQSEDILKLNRAVAAAVNEIRNRSFSERHPELGRMLNCPVCDRRHCEPMCQPKYAVGRWDPDRKPLIASQETAKGAMGAARFAKKRFHPHPNKRGLQLVERTQKLYWEYQPFLSIPEECVKEAKKEAARQLKKERDKERKFKRQQQQIARRINFGLARPGSRP